MPNIADVAEWLDAPAETTYEFGDEYRPVDLETGVKTYSHGSNAFADKYRRLYRALDLAEPHVRGRAGARVRLLAAGHGAGGQEGARRDNGTGHPDRFAGGDYDFHNEAKELTNDTLRQSVTDGVGFHHAGLGKEDRDRVEEWFKQGKIKLLFSTSSTLAWG